MSIFQRCEISKCNAKANYVVIMESNGSKTVSAPFKFPSHPPSHHTLMIRPNCKADEGTGYLAMVRKEVVVEV